MDTHFKAPKDELKAGFTHGPETLELELGGLEAGRNNFIGVIMKTLNLSREETKALYRFEGNNRWFLKTTQQTRQRLVGKTFPASNFSITVRSIEPDVNPVTIHWLSAELSEAFITGIFQKFAEPGTLVVIQNKNRTPDDKWTATLKPKKDLEIPHYLTIQYGEDPRHYRLLVTIPGRRQKCYKCQDDTHWPNQCRGLKQTYASAIRQSIAQPPPWRNSVTQGPPPPASP
jgi:hypothetical protein